jgi:hypothetical protein
MVNAVEKPKKEYDADALTFALTELSPGQLVALAKKLGKAEKATDYDTLLINARDIKSGIVFDFLEAAERFSLARYLAMVTIGDDITQALEGGSHE